MSFIVIAEHPVRLAAGMNPQPHTSYDLFIFSNSLFRMLDEFRTLN